VNRFFRSALFPLVIIAALVWLALQTLGGSKTNATALTTSEFIQKVDSGQVASSTASPVTIDPNKQSISGKLANGQTFTVHYATDQSEFAIEEAMKKPSGVDVAPVTFNSKGVG
jgi:cell division protease FtsH